MTLDDIKLKRLHEAEQVLEKKKKKKKKRRRVTRDPVKGSQIYVDVEEEEKNASNQSGGTLEEGKKKHHTPKFVQHCVSAITEDPKKLAKVQAGGPKGKKGSPFAICHASYKKKTRSKAADHAKQAKGEKKHHTVKDYEKALEKLREATEVRRAANHDPRNIAFGVMHEEVSPRSVRFTPRG